LPPAYQPLTAQRLAELKALADDGNARAACVLGAQLAKCEFFPFAARQGVKQAANAIARHRRDGSEPPAALLRSHERSLATQLQLQAECADVSFGAGHAAWRYQLQAALLGHEDSMAAFSSWPAFDPTDPGTAMDAVAAYVQHAGAFIEARAQRGSLNAVTEASWSYGERGPAVLGMAWLRPLPPDPARALMYQYVRAGVMSRWEQVEPGSSRPWGNPTYGIAAMEQALSESQRAWARQMADQILASSDARELKPPPNRPESQRLDAPWDVAESACRE